APENPRFVRSPGITLTFSRCFNESEGGMSCLTCHDAHRDDFEQAPFFEGKCLSCHSGQGRSEKPAAGAASDAKANTAGKSSVCPVNPKTKCLECHMPKVPIPALHRELTDHFIRVHERGAKN